LELAGGEAFLGGAVAGGAEGVEEAGGEGDFAGEEAARGLLATAIKIGHGEVLLELVMHRFEIPDPADVRVVPLVWICNPDPLNIRIFNPQKQCTVLS